MDRNGVWQLLRLTLRYCPHGGSSRGMRDFLRSAASEQNIKSLKSFAETNPQVEVVSTIRRNRHPAIIALYRSTKAAQEKILAYAPTDHRLLTKISPDRLPTLVDVKNKSEKEIYDVCMGLRNTTGRRLSAPIKKEKFSINPSVQGIWSPGIANNIPFTVEQISNK